MSGNCTQYHPADEELMRFAVGEDGPDLSEHTAACPACARFVKEIEMVRSDLEGLPDEEVSAGLRSRILNRCRMPDTPMLEHLGQPGSWWRNPLLIALGVGVFAVFFYIFFVFLL